jgi:hypothetical protein
MWLKSGVEYVKKAFPMDQKEWNEKKNSSPYNGITSLPVVFNEQGKKIHQTKC